MTSQSVHPAPSSTPPGPIGWPVLGVGPIVLGIIEKRRRTPETYDDLLTLPLEARDEETGEKMTAAQLRGEVMTIYLAGHETTA